jgi:hypothetical protein
MILPLYIRVLGGEEKIFLNKENLLKRKDIVISSVIIIINGIIAYRRGISLFEIGMDAISDMIIVVINSETSSCPI